MSDRHDLLRESCGDSGCSLPAGFFRLRYFHGKQMRLADYVDEQRYHAGKLRFHNERLHGAGILCGLRVSLLDQGGVVLRVGRGAAIDDCGREILVGFDQCVDVDAWYRQQKRKPREDEDDPCHPDAENKVRICVVVRYDECAQAPEPAPAGFCEPACDCGGGCSSCRARSCDPCGDSADFGRVAEDFELRLMFHDEAKRVTEHHLFPDASAIDEAVAQSIGGIGLLQSLAVPIRRRCPSSDEQWLLLACFDAVIGEGDDARVEKIRDIDYDCASQVLLSTEVIQYLLAGLIAEVDPSIGGPEISSIVLNRLDETRYQFVLSLSAPIDPASLDEGANFSLRRLGQTGWGLAENNVVSAAYAETASGKYSVEGPAIYLTVNNAGNYLAAGGRYQLFTPRPADPVVDAALRHLRPRDLEWRFGLEVDADSGNLVIQPLGGKEFAHA